MWAGLWLAAATGGGLSARATAWAKQTLDASLAGVMFGAGLFSFLLDSRKMEGECCPQEVRLCRRIGVCYMLAGAAVWVYSWVWG